MSSGGSPFSDDSLRDALAREADHLSASPALREQVGSLFAKSPAVTAGGSGSIVTALCGILVALLVGVASYQIYDTFIRSPQMTPLSPDWRWENVANAQVGDGSGNADVKKFVQSMNVPVGTLRTTAAKPIGAAVIESACDEPISPVIDYSIGKDKLRIITAPSGTQLAPKDQSKEFKKTFSDKQAAGVLIDGSWVIGIADQSVSEQVIADALQTAMINKPANRP